MDDLIERDKAKMAIRLGVLSTATIYGRTDEGMTARKEIERAIDELPSAQPEPQWIPCSIRPPESGLVLVTYTDGDVDIMVQPTAYREYDIVAWMPLPKPWRGENDAQQDCP